MRDGAIIRADLYRAESQPGPLPVLVIWSPYGKHSPVGIHLQHTPPGVAMALPFVTLPLIVGVMGGPQAILGWMLGALADSLAKRKGAAGV